MVRNNPHYMWGTSESEKLIPFPSVSSILSIVDKSDFLSPWVAKQIVEFIRDNALPQGESHEKEWIVADSVLDHAHESYKATSGRAMSIGSRVHELAENFGSESINWEEEPVEVRNGYEAFVKFTRNENPIFLELERPVVHWNALGYLLESPFSENIPKNKLRPYAYSGTYDAIAEINGRNYILDYKTSKDVYPTHWLQVSSYLKARLSLNGKQLKLFTDFDEPVEKIIDYPEIRLDGVGIVHLDKYVGDYNLILHNMDFVDERFDTFKALAKFWWRYKKRAINNAVA